MPLRVSDIATYQSPWLKASDLRGQAVAVVVERATVEEIRKPDGGKEPKIVIAFMGKSKKLIANKTQALTLADIAKTEEFERWSGLSVILEPAKTRQGQETINIRPGARSQASGAAATASQESPKATSSTSSTTSGDQAAGEGEKFETGVPGPKKGFDNPFLDPTYSG
jgi:hypothetical protein